MILRINFAMNRYDIAFVVTILSKVLLEVQTECFSQATTCHGTEVCRLGSSQSIVVHCNCSGANWCSWNSPSSERGDNYFIRGSSESLLLEWNSTIGYGNFICIRDNNEVVKSILILPDAPRTSCDGCINATICRAVTGKYFYQFSIMLYFAHKPAIPPCELYLNDRLIDDTVTEDNPRCIDFFPNSSYSMICPVCPANDIYYDIPTSNVKNCSKSDVCSPLPTVITAISTVISSGSSTEFLSSTPMLTSLLSSSSFTHSTVTTPTMVIPTISGNPSTSDKLGAIVGGIIGAVFGILVLFIIIMILFKYKRHCVIPQRNDLILFTDGTVFTHEKAPNTISQSDMPNNATNIENTDVSDYLTTDRCKTEDDTLDKDATNKITSDIPSGIHKLRNKTDNPGTNIASSHTASGSNKIAPSSIPSFDFGKITYNSLQSFAQDIYSSVNIQAILPLMIAHGLITRVDQDYFTSTNHILPLEKQERLMFLVISLDEKYVEKFLACLSETDEYAPHGDLLTVIQKGREKTTKSDQ